jgi:hypothetical protein
MLLFAPAPSINTTFQGPNRVASLSIPPAFAQRQIALVRRRATVFFINQLQFFQFDMNRLDTHCDQQLFANFFQRRIRHLVDNLLEQPAMLAKFCFATKRAIEWFDAAGVATLLFDLGDGRMSDRPFFRCCLFGRSAIAIVQNPLPHFLPKIYVFSIFAILPK